MFGFSDAVRAAFRPLPPLERAKRRAKRAYVKLQAEMLLRKFDCGFVMATLVSRAVKDAYEEFEAAYDEVRRLDPTAPLLAMDAEREYTDRELQDFRGI